MERIFLVCIDTTTFAHLVFVPTEPTIYMKKPGAVLLRRENFDATSVTLNKYRYDKKERTQPVVTLNIFTVRTPYSIVIRGIREAMLVVQTYSSTVCT